MNDKQTDLELLKLAAQAASMDVRELPASYPTLWHVLGPDEAVVWNPLDNDSDALRLAVTLKLSIMWGVPHYVQVSAEGPGDECAAWAMEPLDTPWCDAEATRRAIVRAAAAIRALKG